MSDPVKAVTGKWYEPIDTEKFWGDLAPAPSKPEPVHAIDISQERVDETAKRKHEWVGLTDEEKSDIDAKSIGIRSAMYLTEAKLKEKNA